MCSNLLEEKVDAVSKTPFLNKRTAKKLCFSLIFRLMSGYFVIVSDHVSGLTPNYHSNNLVDSLEYLNDGRLVTGGGTSLSYLLTHHRSDRIYRNFILSH